MCEGKLENGGSDASSGIKFSPKRLTTGRLCKQKIHKDSIPTSLLHKWKSAGEIQALGSKVVLVAEGSCTFAVSFYQNCLSIQSTASKMSLEQTESLNSESPPTAAQTLKFKAAN